MEFLLKYSSSALSNRIMLLTVFLFVICVYLWYVITNRVELNKRGKTLAIAVLLLGWSFLVYYIYDSLKEIAELKELFTAMMKPSKNFQLNFLKAF